MAEFKIYTEYKEALKKKCLSHGLNIDLDNPVTIQEKINWLKIYDSTPLKTKCADKIQVHDYCKEKLGEDICIPIIKVYNSTSEINWDELPQQFVMKCNHGSGMNIIVKDKSTLDKADAIRKLNRWMSEDFSFKVCYEMHYHDIPRKIFVEEYKTDKNQTASLYDYKFWCFNGEPKFYTINDGHGHGDIIYYSMDDKIIDPYDAYNGTQSYEKPLNFNKMVEYSKLLSKDFKFVRVDFYEVDGKIYLGELTFTPGAGWFKYKKTEYNKIFGDMLDLGIKGKEVMKQVNKQVKICIVHYNTPKLTECLVKSINKFTPNSKIYIFDNSDKFPFNEKFDNVEIIDNTKGQIINFDKWLEKYPRKTLSPGKLNKWGSAKHCYSVEKCMEIIGDDFILLDSDVLLKKDISNLYDNNFVCVGEIITQPKSTIKRIVPYITYINVNACKEKGFHYFDETHMHGLRVSTSGDMYDTGSGFYLQIKNEKIKEIKCFDYIEHFKGGSWNVEHDKKFGNMNIDYKQWLSNNEGLWDDNITKKKKVVYTCITGDYDNLSKLTKFEHDFDYICFTDSQNITNNFWKIRPIPEELLSYSKVKQQRCIKINPHKYLPEYDLSVWVDAVVDIRGDLNEFISNKCADDASIFIPTHPQRKCIYKEAEACVKLKKDTPDNINPQIKRYEKEGFPKDFGLVQSNIIIRKHNDPDCIKLMECWWNELKNGSHRDQLSFNYAMWKNPDVKVCYLDKSTCNSSYFLWGKSHAKKKSAEELNKDNKNIQPKCTSRNTSECSGFTKKESIGKTTSANRTESQGNKNAYYDTYENEYTKFNSNKTLIKTKKTELSQKYRFSPKKPLTKSLKAFLGI